MRNYAIVIEYKHLAQHIPSSVFVLPSASSIRVWDGVIFIKHGIYRGGIFRFVLHIPDRQALAMPLHAGVRPFHLPRPPALDISPPQLSSRWSKTLCPVFVPRVPPTDRRGMMDAAVATPPPPTLARSCRTE